MRHLKPGSVTFTMLLGSAMAMQLLGMYVTLPALPTISTYFGAAPDTTQLTISAFLAGIAMSQLAYGAISDRYGRKPTLLGGLTLYILSGLGCAFAPSIEWLIALRALQGMGAAGSIVVSRAMVRDLFERGQAVQMMSRLGIITAAVPMVAPLVGALILPLTGWRGVFAVLAVMSITVAVACVLLLGESIPKRDHTATDPRRILANCWTFLTTPGCLAFVLMFFCASGCMFGYSANSAFVFMNVFGLSSADYGWLLTLNTVVLVVASTVSERIARRWSIRQTLSVISPAFMLMGLVALASTQFATHAGMTGAAGVAFILVPMLIFTFIMGIQFSNLTTAALHPVPQISGVASALLGSAQMAGAGFFVWLGGWMFDGTSSTIGYGVAIGSTCSFLLYHFVGRRHAPAKR